MDLKEFLTPPTHKTSIERHEYIQKLIPLLRRKEVIVLKGIRRSGKSTIIKQLIQRLIKQGESQPLYLNLEDYRLRNHLTLETIHNIIKEHKHYTKAKKQYVFLDEVQQLPDWERLIRTLYDESDDIKFIVTGSNASLLSKELSTLLTGRNLTLEVFPLSYTEYQTFTQTPQLQEYLLYGGFPEVVLEGNQETKKALLTQYFEDIIYKDIINRHGIRNTQDIFKLATHLIENSGTPFSINNLAKSLDLNNNTVDTYISYLLDTYLLHRVDHFNYSAKKRYDKQTQPKYYVLDNGFTQITPQFSQDKGQQFENAVLQEIRRKYTEILYWKDQYEVDFVYATHAIQVTISTTDIPEREYANVTAFVQKHKQYTPLLVTSEKTYEETGVKTLSFHEFSAKNP